MPNFIVALVGILATSTSLVGAFRAQHHMRTKGSSVSVRILSAQCTPPIIAESLNALIPTWVAAPWLRMDVDGNRIVFFGEDILTNREMRVHHERTREVKISAELFDGEFQLGKYTLDAGNLRPSVWHRFEWEFKDKSSRVIFEIRFNTFESHQFLDQAEGLVAEYRPDQEAAINRSHAQSLKKLRQLLGVKQQQLDDTAHKHLVDQGLVAAEQPKERVRRKKKRNVAGRETQVGSGRGWGATAPTLQQVCLALAGLSPEVERSRLNCEEQPHLGVYFACPADEPSTMLVCYYKKDAYGAQFCSKAEQSGQYLSQFKLEGDGSFKIPVQTFLRESYIMGTLLPGFTALKDGQLTKLDRPSGSSAEFMQLTYLEGEPQPMAQVPDIAEDSQRVEPKAMPPPPVASGADEVASNRLSSSEDLSDMAPLQQSPDKAPGSTPADADPDKAEFASVYEDQNFGDFFFSGGEGESDDYGTFFLGSDLGDEDPYGYDGQY